MKQLSWVLLAAAFAASAEPRAETQARIGVMDLQANGATEQLASAAGGVAANEISRLGFFEVVTSEAIRSLIAIERQRELLGCAEESCMTELAGALGIDYAVTGKVSRLEGQGGMPTTFTLELMLLDVVRARQEASDVQVAQSEAELLGKVSRSVAKLLSKLLEGRSGQLIVAASETGAVVKVDDVVMGTTPLSNRLSVSGGPHFLSVEKDGFVAFQRQVQVEPGQLTEEQVVLVPSPDYVRGYEAHHGRMRLGAWLSSGLAVAGLGVAGWLQWEVQKTYGTAETDGTFAFHQAKLLAGIETEEGVDHRQAAQRLRDRISGYDTGTYVGLGVGGAAALTATWFFIAGDDPGRYARYRATPTLSFAPLPGGGAAFVQVGF